VGHLLSYRKSTERLGNFDSILWVVLAVGEFRFRAMKFQSANCANKREFLTQRRGGRRGQRKRKRREKTETFGRPATIGLHVSYCDPGDKCLSSSST
jgi:hypothetical protein